ncbi:hypothetical protein DYQ86_26955 [Acidobacteria bacterium AB60]|nr:hypothetical protein DYQ86_26955 [Acidobacteria bacterium AB60]
MNATLYILTALTTLLCAILLLRAYFRVRRRLLLWAGLCFAWLTVSNFLVIGDLLLFPSIDLYSYRLGSSAIAMILLIYGLVWESQ